MPIFYIAGEWIVLEAGFHELDGVFPAVAALIQSTFNNFFDNLQQQFHRGDLSFYQGCPSLDCLEINYYCRHFKSTNI